MYKIHIYHCTFETNIMLYVNISITICNKVKTSFRTHFHVCQLNVFDACIVTWKDSETMPMHNRGFLILFECEGEMWGNIS